MIKYIFRYNKRQWFYKWSSVKLIPQCFSFYVLNHLTLLIYSCINKWWDILWITWFVKRNIVTQRPHNFITSCILPIYFRQLNPIVFYDLIFFPAFCFRWWHCITLTRFLRINILPQRRLFQPKQHKAKRRNKVVTVHLHHVIS